jgi:hypothetical protein
LAKTHRGDVVLPLLLVNVPIFVQEFVDDGFQPHSLPLSVSRNSNVLLCDFEGHLSELQTKLSPTSHRKYSFSITKTIWLRLLMEMKEIFCIKDGKRVNIV